MITTRVVYPSLGAHLEHISHDYKFCRRKRDWIDHLTFIIVQQTLQLTPQGNGLQVLVQIQSLPKIQILPQFCILPQISHQITNRIITPYKFSQ